MVKLFCAIVGVGGSAFSVEVGEGQSVDDLKEAIKNLKRNDLKGVDRDKLQLFLAKKKNGKGVWLTEKDVQNGVSDTSDLNLLGTMGAPLKFVGLLEKDVKFEPTLKDIESMNTPVHVLVVVPKKRTSTAIVSQEKDAKRLKKEENVPLEMLWQYSEMEITTFPQPHELSSLLQRPLPFQLKVREFVTMTAIFDPSGPFLVCEDLTTLIDAFLLSCEDRYRPGPEASENTWQHIYDLLLDISYHLCKAYGFDVVSNRNRANTTGTTDKVMRPDFLLHYLGMVLLRGEEYNATTEIEVSWKKLTNKMLFWNPMFYGDLPYTLGYATSGERLRVVTIDRHLNPHTIFDFQSIFQQRAQVIKMFYNLPFFLHKMSVLAKRTCPSYLMPFTPDENHKRKIELRDNVIVRTIQRKQCRDDVDFERLVDIYSTLQDLDDRAQKRTHLQIVRNLDVKKSRLCVQLSPLGNVRAPVDVDEVRVWLQGMLTALKYWHSCDYCHGDLRWSNIVRIPVSSDSGFWVLIDMDESRKPNTTTIDWNHKFQGHTLIFEHDMYQLGQLMNSLTFSLPSDLVEIQKYLLSAVDTPVDDLLTLLLNHLHD
ncbi:hypothetical protein DVH05_014711 [Phytophthora capsici]|nr:hypothetical protein DVH05_014711 [Phytophthora capsici]